MQRREFLGGLGAVAALAAGRVLFKAIPAKGADMKADAFPYTLTDAEWKKKLSAQQYDILRKQGTERSFTSPLVDEHRKGTFDCAGCDNLLFNSDTKFDSGTGWPSFWKPATDKSVGTTSDVSLMMERTEVHCANCGGHLGHVFDDGPKPTGLRYCMNGAVLTFKPAA